jgi:hypothetical protein
MIENIALLADGNSAAARRARVKLQPRDKKGRWVPTGATLLAAIRSLNGIAKQYRLKAIGGTATSKGEKNKIRALLLEDAPELGLKKNTVLEVDPKNGELESKIKLDRDYLKKKGIDPDLQHTLPKSIAEQPQDVSDMNPQPADDLDIELANGGLTDEEDKDFRKERDDEPLGKLPPGLEELDEDELSKLVDGDSGKDDNSPVKGVRIKFDDENNSYVATNDHNQVVAWGVSDKPLNKGEIIKDLKDYELPNKEAVEGLGFPEGYVGKDRGKGGFVAYQLDSNGQFVPGTVVEVGNDTDFDWDNEEMWSVGDPMGNAMYLDPDIYSFRTSDKDEAISRAADLAKKITGTPSGENNDSQDGLSDEMLEKAVALEDHFDQLVDKAKSPPKTKSAETLDKGDVVDVGGSPLLVKSVVGTPGAGGKKVRINWEKLDGTSGFSDVDSTREVPVSATKRSEFGKKTPPPSPTAKPAAKTPAAPTPPTPKKTVAPPPPKPPAPKANTPKAPPVIPNNRKDTGADIAPNNRPIGDMQNVKIQPLIDPNTGRPLLGQNRKPIEDPNAIYNALLEYNPQAKIDDSGHIILERQNFTDKDGRVWKYEVAIAKTHGNKYTERYTFTDDKGETQTFYHYDYKDSFAAIYGDRNGVYTFRDQILGKTSAEKPTRKNGEENRVYKAFWADDKPLEARIRYFRGARAKGRGEPTDEELMETQAKAIRMLTPEELIRKYIQGNPEKYNNSGQAKGTKLQSFVGSGWEAINNNDLNTFEGLMIQLLGRLPDTEASRNLLINTLRKGISEKYNGTGRGRELATLANNLEKKILTEGFDLRDISRRPFSSKDGKTIVQKDNKVRYWNNVGEWSIGTVMALLPSRKVGNKIYDDVVAVKFGDGKIGLLRSNRMDILGDNLDNDLNLHDKDSDSTEYKRNKSGQALRDARGYTYSFGDEETREYENEDAEPDDVVNTADTDPAAPYLGEQGESADESESTEDPADEEDSEANSNISICSPSSVQIINAYEAILSFASGEDPLNENDLLQGLLLCIPESMLFDALVLSHYN